jgi:hypothetical protein
MERPLLRIVLIRAALVATPFVIWFLWAAWARRNGRVLGATPYGWLFAAGAVLAGLSLFATVLLRPDNREELYVPGEATASGAVTPGHFEKAAPP